MFFIFFFRSVGPEAGFPTHLVEVLQEVHYATLNLLLLKTGSGGIETNRLAGESGSDLRGADNGRAADLEGSRGLDDTRHGGGPQRPDNSGAEHNELKSENMEAEKPEFKMR